MTRLELKWPCPVCLGATLEKSTIDTATPFTIDHCPRCGGVWFEHGEVQRLRRCTPSQLWQKVAEMDGVHRMQCHSCSTPLARGSQRCDACGWQVELDCPACNQPMEAVHHDGIELDVCRRCKGVWFDRHELAAIWRLEFGAALKRRHAVADGSLVLLDALAYDPFLVFYGAHAAGHVLSAGADAASSSAPAVLEAAAEAASSVFETIVDIIGGIFS